MPDKRPKSHRDNPTVAFRVERDRQERLQRLAAARGVTVSDLLRSLTDRFLDEEKVPA